MNGQSDFVFSMLSDVLLFTSGLIGVMYIKLWVKYYHKF